jgi:hypothetical protein
VAGLPFFMVIGLGSFISRRSRHLRQYASISSLLRWPGHAGLVAGAKCSSAYSNEQRAASAFCMIAGEKAVSTEG